MWNKTQDTWHVKRYMWWEVNIRLKFQVPSSQADTHFLFYRDGTWLHRQQDLEENDEQINEWQSCL